MLGQGHHVGRCKNKMTADAQQLEWMTQAYYDAGPVK
jgi:hypothetical protein